jgi:hypothetical protein
VLLVGSEIFMIKRVSIRPVVKGKEGMEGFLELSNDVQEAFFDEECLPIFSI